MHTIAARCHESSSIETSMCLLDFGDRNYIAIYSKAQGGRLIARSHITESYTFLRLDTTYMGGKAGTPPTHECMGLKGIHLHISDVDENSSLNIDNTTFQSLSANPAWASARALDVPIGDPACYSLRGNFHKEPPRVVIDGVRGVNHFADHRHSCFGKKCGHHIAR